MTYKKVYTDQIRSSTLASQLTQLWKRQLMCDAEIRLGNVVVKAHRLVLVASCGILHCLDNTNSSAILEVTLPDDISSKHVHTFLEYLYEGHIILSEENFEGIEKIARLLNVQDVLSCCNDFLQAVKLEKQLNKLHEYEEYSLKELNTAKHIRSTSLIKSGTDTSSQVKGDRGQRPASSHLNLTYDLESNLQKSKTSLSFSSTPTSSQKQRLNLGLDRNHGNNLINQPSGTTSSSTGVIDLSDSSHTSCDSLPNQRRHSDQTHHDLVHRNIVSPKRRHSYNTSSRPSSTDSHGNNQTIVENRQIRSTLNQHTPISMQSAQSAYNSFMYGMPVLPPNLWTDKTTLQHHMFSPHSDRGFSEQRNSDVVPVSLSQVNESPDKRMLLDMCEIDLSLVKDEPLDLHMVEMEQNQERPDDIRSEETSLISQSERTNQVHRDLSQHMSQEESKRQSSQPLMMKKKLSTNVQRIIQNLNLNRRAMASPSSLNSLAVGNHKPVRMPGKNNYKVCSLCYQNKIRTKSGYYVYSYYKCSACDVPLCIGRRKCFLEYHKAAESK